MNKILVGLIVGAVLGAVDGLTAWFTPQVRDQMLGIVIGSTAKGIIAGIAAGWYARRVQSVPKGILFGFVVGLVLAFAIAAMPDPNTGEHYWWQIMVPGSILGGVIGWATQQYGRVPSPKRAASAAMLLLLALPGVSAQAAEEHHATPATNPAFEKLKGLSGTRNATILSPDGDKTMGEYGVSGAGTVVMETMFAGSPHEMINMYTVDKGGVLAAHYCSSGNQPLLRLNAEKSTADELVFDYVSRTGADTAYINGVRLQFAKDGKVTEVWSSSGSEEPMTLYLHGRK